MKAVVFHLPKKVAVDRVTEPTILEPTDCVIRVTTTAICGSDLHIYNGAFPQFKNMILGHEFMGIVEETGKEVRRIQKGDRVIVPFPIGCGTCWFCRHGLTTACEKTNPRHYGPEGAAASRKGGGMYGYTDLYGGYPGGQSEYVRVLYGDFNARRVPDNLKDEQVLLLTDIFPTGWCGINWAQPRPGDTVAVFGCGPVGLMAQKAAWLHDAGRVIGIDIVPYRLEMARTAARAETINAADEDPVAAVRDKTEGRGADICVDAVGMEVHRGFFKKIANVLHMQRGSITALENCISAARRCGTVVDMGVYATTYDNFPLGQMFDKAVTLRLGQALEHR